MPKLTMAQRKKMPRTDFAIPEKAPASGSYPIRDRKHARLALEFSSGKPVAGRVRAAVQAKFPDMLDSHDTTRAFKTAGYKKRF